MAIVVVRPTGHQDGGKACIDEIHSFLHEEVGLFSLHCKYIGNGRLWPGIVDRFEHSACVNVHRPRLDLKAPTWKTPRADLLILSRTH